jgi:DNA-binding response OmpR family regulator
VTLEGRQVLLVEDERALADALLVSLKKLKTVCVWAKNLKEARELIAARSFDFWILDRNLPDGEGLSLLDEGGRRAQVLVLSAKSEVADRVLGLKAGAEDYLSKPFSFAELSARLEVMARRIPASVPKAEAKPETSFVWRLNRDRLEVTAPNGVHTLTPLEFKVLEYLIEREATIVSKDRLLKDVWGFTFLPKTRTVDYLVTQLRKRLEPEPEQPVHLVTVRGAGIRFHS